MNRHASQLVVAILGLGLLAATAFFLMRGRSHGAGEGLAGDGTDIASPVAALGTSRPTSVHQVPTAHEGLREEVTKSQANGDPDWQAALAGFTGRLVTPEAKPVPGKLVKLYRFDPSVVFLPGVTPMGDRLLEPDLDMGEARSGDDGRFTIPGVFPGSSYALVADAGGEIPHFRMIERSPGPAQVVDLGDIVLSVGATVTGIVVDAESKPIAGALVRALDLPGVVLAAMPLERFDPNGALLMRSLPDRRSGGKVVFSIPAWIQRRFEELPIPKTRSDQEGKFTLRGLDPGVNALMVTSANLSSFVNSTLRLRAGQTKDVGTIKLEPGETAQGRVIDTQGKPVAGAEVLVAQTSPVAPVDIALRAPNTTADGRFSCSGLKPGQATVAARRSAKEPWTICDPTPVGSDIVIKLPAVAVLTVKLVSKVGRAIEGPRIKLYPSLAEEPWALLGMLTPLELGDRLEALEGGVLRIRDLAVGEYRIAVECTDHAAATAEVELKTDAVLKIDLEGKQKVRVLVTDTRGAPVRNAAVHFVWGGMGRGRLPLHAGQTAADGHVDVELQANVKDIQLTASHPRFAQVHKTSSLPIAEVKIVMPDTGSLAGRVTSNGRPPEAGKYVVMVLRHWSDQAGRGALPAMARIALPDPEGGFKMTGLSPGRYYLEVRPSLAGVHSAGTFYNNVLRVSAIERSVDVEVTSGQTTEVTIDTETPVAVSGPAARVFGTAFVDGRPAVGLKIRGWGARRLSADVDAAGRFDLGRVQAGSVNLALTESEGDSWRSGLWSASFQLEADKDREIRIDVQTGTVTGVVIGADGRGMAGATVRGNMISSGKAKNEVQESASFETLADGSGRFEVKGVRLSMYNVRADLRGVGRSAWTPCEAFPAGLERAIELRILRTVQVGGRVDIVASGIDLAAETGFLQFRPVQPNGVPPNDGSGGEAATSSFRKDGKFRLQDGLPPGTYQVTAWVQEKEYQALEHVVVSEAPLTDLMLVLRLKSQVVPQTRR